MEKHLSISRGNSKMGNVSSISLPPILTCGRACEKCYALKLYKLRKTVKSAWDNNYEILQDNPELFWREVEAAIMSVTYWRFHVSGDIPYPEYFSKVVEIAKRNQHCTMLMFTKRYDWVNEFIDTNGELPSNLKVIFSAWRDVSMNNKHNLPTAHVLYKDGFTTAHNEARFCSGNCMTCFTEKSGCIKLKKGQEVIFRQH